MCHIKLDSSGSITTTTEPTQTQQAQLRAAEAPPPNLVLLNIFELLFIFLPPQTYKITPLKCFCPTMVYFLIVTLKRSFIVVS